MRENKYKSYRFVEQYGKAKWVVVDETGKIVNMNPSKDELDGLEREPYITDYHQPKKYTDEELLNELIRFKKEHGRSPIKEDFKNNPEYPSYVTYQRRFGSWYNALKIAGLDIDLMGPQGNSYRGRQTEITVLNHFKQHPIDLAGENQNSTYDGICPNGKTYDVKSSKFDLYTKRYHFRTTNKDKDDDKEAIQWYYLIALNDGAIKYVWRVPGEIVEKDDFHIGISPNHEFNIENMEEFEITSKFKDIFN